MNLMLTLGLVVVVSMLPTVVAVFRGLTARWRIAALNLTPWAAMAVASAGIAAWCPPSQLEAVSQTATLGILLAALATYTASVAWAFAGAEATDSARWNAPGHLRVDWSSILAFRDSI